MFDNYSIQRTQITEDNQQKTEIIKANAQNSAIP